MKRRAGLMAGRKKQVLIARMRIDSLCFNLDVAKLDRPADVDQITGQLRLRLERDHPAIPNPARQPIDEAALIGANVADDIARQEAPPDNAELGSLVAKPRLQGSNPKADTLGSKPGLKNRHGVNLPLLSMFCRGALFGGFDSQSSMEQGLQNA